MFAKLKLYYVDGSNYKDNWSFDMDIDAFYKFYQDQDSSFDFIDSECRESLIEIEWLGLDKEDIPMIRTHGFNEDFDHNFVSITGVSNMEEVKKYIQHRESKERKEKFVLELK